MRKLMSYCFILFPCLLAGQEVLTLSQCHQLIGSLHPLSKVKTITEENRHLRSDALKSGYLPHVSLHATAGYQSDVTKVDVDFPGIDIPYPSNDQYRMTLDVSQPIFDGGMLKAQIESADIASGLEIQEEECSLQQLYEKVNALYESILLAQEKESLLLTGMHTLNAQWKQMRSAVQNGAMLPKNADAIEAEILKQTQELKIIKAKEKSLEDMLSQLIHKPFDGHIRLQLPEVPAPDHYELNKRPEIASFTLQQKLTETEMQKIKAGLSPRLTAFAQGGYGRPGLNMLDDSFNPYYIAGLQFSWDISALYSAKREKEMIAVKKERIDKKKEAFELSTSLEFTQLRAEILALEESLDTDKEIIRLREKIANAAASGFEHGIYTVSEFIQAQNELRTAKLNQKMHLIQLRMKQADWYVKQGLTIEK